MILSGEMGDGAPRVVAQFLEGGTAFGVISPDAAAACLRRACATVPITDVCLGWRLPSKLVDVVADEARQLGCSVWLWQPLLSGDGIHVPARDSARGPLAPVPWPNGKAEFAFDCPVRATGLAAALERLEAALSVGLWDGVFIDKIRWPSPSRDPSEDLACFCEECRDAAVSHDIDLAFVASCLASARTSPQGRLDLVAELLGRPSDGPLAPFLEWRCARITQAAGAAVERATSIRGAGGERLRVALDVFTPSLARSVGQDIGALAPQAEFVKAMTYLGTHGPAGLPFELCRLSRWLAAGGVDGAIAHLEEMLGFDLASREGLCVGALSPHVMEAELGELQELAGEQAAVGIDAVTIPSLAVMDDETLFETARIALTRRTTIVLSWICGRSFRGGSRCSQERTPRRRRPECDLSDRANSGRAEDLVPGSAQGLLAR